MEIKRKNPTNEKKEDKLKRANKRNEGKVPKKGPFYAAQWEKNLNPAARDL